MSFKLQIRNFHSFFTMVCFSILLMLSGMVIAQQTDNHVLHAVPAGKVVVDGKLNDWDLSGQVDVFANYRMRNTYSTKVAAMYDKDNFYLSIVWRDPTPMFNMVDSNFDIGSEIGRAHV